ncbi:hypothetical protein TNCV_1211601 [Trichonephila clavipes]|nr:hypothetical protein TNCV_1211601 [Trichonephila clavipes]
MFDSSSFVYPTPLAHADTSRDVLPMGGTSQLLASSSVKMLMLIGEKADNASTISNLNFKRSILIFGGILFDIVSCLHRNQGFATAKTMKLMGSKDFDGK